MMTIILAQAVSIACPVYMPGDTAYPTPVAASCPAPLSGLVYPWDHDRLDADAAAQLRRDAETIHRLEAVAAEHADELHPLAWVLTGALLGAGLTLLAVRP